MRAALACALALLAGCASGGKPAGDVAPPPPASDAARRSSEIIYQDEIAAAGATDAYDAIRRLRPRFLGPHAATTQRRPEGVRIVVDGVTVRSDELRTVAASAIVYIRYLTASEASVNWGGGIDTPVVYVLTRAGPPAR